MHTRAAAAGFWKRIRFVLVLLTVLAGACLLGAYFFLRGQGIMQEELRSHLRSSAAVAVLSIDPGLVRAVDGPDDVGSPAFRALLAQVQDVRLSDGKILYAYIMRRTEDPGVLAFVIDADSALSDADLDENGDGIVDESEAAALPGEPYDVSDDAFVALREEAFSGPAVDRDVTHDRWGSYISGYAPIRDGEGNVIAVLGLDMDAGEFIALSQSIFSPIALLLVMFAGVALAAYVQYMWHRRGVEAMRQLDAERTALLDLATHQLGMPLATFKWWLEILRDKDHGKFCEKNGICDEMQHGIDRMDGIIRSLHEANHLSRGSIDYRATRTDLEKVIREAVDSMRGDVAQRGQSVTFSASGNVPPLSADPKLIGGVVSELIENARMYSPSGARIEVRLSRQRNDAVIDVTDTGYGIADDEQKSIFQKFKRGRDALKHKPVGNGLGLYIAKGIVERAGGTISLRSKPGQGTRIRISLPLS